jgi:hypothetical protein
MLLFSFQRDAMFENAVIYRVSEENIYTIWMLITHIQIEIEL